MTARTARQQLWFWAVVVTAALILIGIVLDDVFSDAAPKYVVRLQAGLGAMLMLRTVIALGALMTLVLASLPCASGQELLSQAQPAAEPPFGSLAQDWTTLGRRALRGVGGRRIARLAR